MESGHPHINSLPSGILHTILGKLGPRDLCSSSAVCTYWHALNLDKETNRLWRKFFSQRWPVQRTSEPSSWRTLYGRKVQKSWIWHGKYQEDSLYGHKSGVRCIKLLPEHNLIATGSLDRTVRLWDLDAGLPLSTSKLHGGTVRCLGLADDMLLSGSTDAVLRVWDLSRRTGNELPSPKKLHGHTGPISGLSVSESRVYSGSWDCSVRIWSLSELKCIEVFTYGDWVWSLACRGDTLVVATGKDIVLQDVPSGKCIFRAVGLRKQGHVSCLEASQDGRYVFSGAADGSVQMHDTRAKLASCDLWQYRAGVSGLAFEDPWLASSSHDGTIALIDLQKKLHSHHRAESMNFSLHSGNPDHRQLATRTGPIYCVDMCNEWLACGSESSVVKSWDFRGAEEAAVKSLAQRDSRRKKKAEKLDLRRCFPHMNTSDVVLEHPATRSESSEDSDPSNSVEQLEVTLIPPSELLPHGCGFESQVRTHVKSREFGDEEEVV